MNILFVFFNIEQSKAVSCPTVAHQLSGAKNIQQVLANNDVLKRFIDGNVIMCVSYVYHMCIHEHFIYIRLLIYIKANTRNIQNQLPFLK